MVIFRVFCEPSDQLVNGFSCNSAAKVIVNGLRIQAFLPGCVFRKLMAVQKLGCQHDVLRAIGANHTALGICSPGRSQAFKRSIDAMRACPMTTAGCSGKGSSW